MVNRGLTAEPLTEKELDVFVEAASGLAYPHRLIAHIVPYTGLTCSEFCHLRREWVVYRGNSTSSNVPDSLVIHIPEESPCTGTLRHSPHDNSRYIERREEPCYQCKPDGTWTLGADCRVRRIPVYEPVAIDTLYNWFQRYDSFPFSPSNSRGWIDEIAAKADLSKEVDWSTLRNTYTFLLISKGFDSETIADILGISSRFHLKPLFELADQPTDWEEKPHATHAELLEELRRLTDQLGYPPRAREINEYGEFSFDTYTRRFGRIDTAFEEAGIDAPEGKIRTTELIEALQRLTDELDPPPQAEDIREHGEFSYYTYKNRFGSRDNALKEAGIDVPEGHISTDELIEDLQRLADELNRPPRSREIDEHGKFSYWAYRNRFGGLNDALKEVGIDVPEGRISTDELIEDLQRLADELDRPLRSREIGEYGEFSFDTYYNRFGGLNDALDAAGLLDDES